MKSNPMVIGAGGRACRRRAWFAAIFLASFHWLAAQTAGSAVIRGHVSNAATGDLLPGAQIRVEGTAIAATADRGGEYRVNLPAGRHTLVVSYTGLETARAEIDVQSGRDLVRDVPLAHRCMHSRNSS